MILTFKGGDFDGLVKDIPWVGLPIFMQKKADDIYNYYKIDIENELAIFQRYMSKNEIILYKGLL